MSRKKEKKYNGNTDEPVELDIPEDEIWTYQIEGLKAPHINQPFTNFTLKKVLFVVGVVLAAGLSIFFSVQALRSDTLVYKETENGCQLSSFKNTGYITEITVDYAGEIVYDRENLDINSNFSFSPDKSRPVTEIREYAFNCDEKLEYINIGADVEKLSSKSFYTCRQLKCIYVDEANPYYCDIDGVLYTKDLSEIICYPMNHGAYLEEKYGFDGWPEGDEAKLAYYKRDVQTYVLPSSVKKIDDLCFNYTNLAVVYMPEGLETIGSMSFFKAGNMAEIFSYTSDSEITETAFVSQDVFTTVYNSLPEGLKYIGSDAFGTNQSLTYMFIPSSVEHIGHHAFFGCIYDDGGWKGLTEVNVALDEASFNEKEIGDQWVSEYSFLKYVPVNYSATRK